jgi:hypothetical protein
MDIRELLQPAVKKQGDPLHLGLLEHDLGDPYLVRDITLAPGQGALFQVKPGDQRLLKRGEGKWHSGFGTDRKMVK